MYEAVELYWALFSQNLFCWNRAITDTKDVDAYSRKCGIWASWGQGKQHVQFVNITIAIGPFSNQFIL